MLFQTKQMQHKFKVGDRVVFKFIDKANFYEDTIMATIKTISGQNTELSLAGEWVDGVTKKSYPKGYVVPTKLDNIRPVH